VWPTLLVGMRNEDAAGTEADSTAQSASHRLSDTSQRLNDSGIELISSASSSSASDSWLAQVSVSCCLHPCAVFLLYALFTFCMFKLVLTISDQYVNAICCFVSSQRFGCWGKKVR